MRIFISRNTREDGGSVALWSERPHMFEETESDDPTPHKVWDDGKDMETFLGALNPSRTGFDEVCDGLAPLLKPLLIVCLLVQPGGLREVRIGPVEIVSIWTHE